MSAGSTRSTSEARPSIAPGCGRNGRRSGGRRGSFRPCLDDVDSPFAVTRGLDPRVHLLRIGIDCRVKPGNDVGEYQRQQISEFVSPEGTMKTQLTRMTLLTAGVVAHACLSLLAGPIGLAAAQEPRPTAAPIATPIAPHPSTQEPVHRMTFEQVVAMERSLSNWGRWGADDERGTLNLVTPEKTKQALTLVKDGTVVSLARFASLEKTIDDFNFGPTRHEMWYGLAGPPKPGETRGALDTISYGLHDGTNSHLDALCHYTLLRDGKVPWPQAREAAGLHASVMPWLKQRDIALLGSDAVNDVQPSGIVGGSGEAANRPVHLISIAVMGMPLVDNGYFEDAAKEAAARKRWEFFMTVQITNLEGGTATNFNALGIF